MRLIVPDASVILKWVLPEADKDVALHILDDFAGGNVDLIVPSLWSYEVGHALWRAVPHSAKALLESLIQLDLTERPLTDKSLHQLGSIKGKYKVSFYDASYHALAIAEDAVFVTADEQYFRMAKSLGSITMLKNWHVLE